MSGCKIKKIRKNDDIFRIIQNEFYNEFCDEFVLIGKDETCLPKYYQKYADAIESFEVRDDDILVCSYPKNGTTWVQEMVWLIANDLDYEGAKVYLDERFPFLELSTLFDTEKFNIAMAETVPKFVLDSVNYSRCQKSPRLIKTHLPYSLLPEQLQHGAKSPKMIYVMRNVKDVCVSYYYHCQLLQGFQTNLENFSKVFMTERILYGSYWNHISGYWNRRDSPNLLIIHYEDMKKDLLAVIKTVATFLSKQLSEQEIELLSKHLSFESMKNNKSVNLEDWVNHIRRLGVLGGCGSFIRSGAVGAYKEELSPTIIKQMDLWIQNSVSSRKLEYNYNV